MDERWLESDVEATNAKPAEVAQILDSFAETLRDAPEGKYYDLELSIDERDA